VTNQNHRVSFPPDFLWGAATASFQIEGAANEDGRGQSIWDTFCRTPGKVANGDTGDVACDHYHRYPEDIELLSRLGVKAYRFSLAWPRILPEGTGKVNSAGLDFYDRLVDAVLAKGIEPFATLYHWDLPQALQDKGGWPNRDSVEAFVNYADVVSHRLGDRIQYWMTHNEPWCAGWLGYGMGQHAPGIQDFQQAIQATHHLLLSHGKAVPVVRANGGPNTKVGIVLNPSWVDPINNVPEDRAAAHRIMGFRNRWYMDPLYKGEYPGDMMEIYDPILPSVQQGDMAAIAAPTDFLGVNYYNRDVVGDDAGFEPLHVKYERPQGEYTEMDWEVYPPGLYNMLMWAHQTYAPPALYVTENGAAFRDELTADGKVLDDRRQAYLEGYIAQVSRAVQDGVPVRGYFVWSLLDNFEWSWGYTRRFGIVHVDYETQKRTMKQSGEWYSQVVRDNGFALSNG
jgi:beta-glucosidase